MSCLATIYRKLSKNYVVIKKTWLLTYIISIAIGLLFHIICNYYNYLFIWGDGNYTFMNPVVYIIPLSYIIYLFHNGGSHIDVSKSYSTKEWKSIINQKYILYLRGFVTDQYEKKDGFILESDDVGHFSEYYLHKAFAAILPMYAVGNKEEVNTPYGAKRIYVDDDCWEDQVEKLVDNAQIVIINIHKSDSCITEILKSTKWKDKILYIVSDIAKYKDVYERVCCSINYLPFPYEIEKEINKDSIKRFVAFNISQNGTMNLESYSCSLKSYIEFAKNGIGWMGKNPHRESFISRVFHKFDDYFVNDLDCFGGPGWLFLFICVFFANISSLCIYTPIYYLIEGKPFLWGMELVGLFLFLIGIVVLLCCKNKILYIFTIIPYFLAITLIVINIIYFVIMCNGT